MLKRKEEKRDQILDSARKLFLERGYFDTRMEDIAADADLAIGTLYLYFKNKNEIYASLCEHALGILDDLFAEALKDGRNSWDKMEAIAKVHLRFYKKYRSYYDIIAFVFLGLQAQLSAELQDKILGRITAIINYLEEVIAFGMEAGEILKGDVKDTAAVLLATVLGVVWLDQAGFLAAQGKDLDTVALSSMRMAFRGLRA
jgi:AcrR family transcriptional regulator